MNILLITTRPASREARFMRNPEDTVRLYVLDDPREALRGHKFDLLIVDVPRHLRKEVEMAVLPYVRRDGETVLWL